MGLMKAMRGVATGYLGARVDMMAAEAKKKREDEIRAAEEAHDLNKLNDKYKLEKAMRTELLEIELGHKTKKELEAEKKDLDDRRTYLSGQGYTKEMLDILELQGHLRSDAAWGVWFKIYDDEMKRKGYNVDWHIAKGNDGLTFQDTYVNRWQDYIIGKGTNGFGMKDSIDDSLNKNNDIPPNSADALTSTNEEIEEKTSGQQVETEEESFYKEGQIPGPIQGVIKTKPSIDEEEKIVEGSENNLLTNDHYLSNFDKPALQPVIYISDKNDKNWALAGGMNPNDLPEGQMLILTLNAQGTGYTPKFQKIADTVNELQAATDKKSKDIVTAIYDNKGLFGEVDDLNLWMQGGNNIQSWFAKNKENQQMFTDLFNISSLLDTTYKAQGITNISSQTIVQQAIKLREVSKSVTAFAWVKDFQQYEPDTAEGLNSALAAVNYVNKEIRNQIASIDTSTDEGKLLAARIQDKVLTMFKHNWAIGHVDEKERTAAISQNPKYQRALRLMNEIILDKKAQMVIKENFGKLGKKFMKQQNLQEKLLKLKGHNLVQWIKMKKKPLWKN